MTSSPTFQRFTLEPTAQIDAGRIGAGDMERMLVDVEGRDRLAEPGPDAVVVDAGRHHEDQHLVLADRPGRHHLDLQGDSSGGPWRSCRMAQAYILSGTWPSGGISPTE